MAELEIDGEKFSIRPLTWGEDNQILDSAGDIDEKTGLIKLKVGTVRKLTVLFGVQTPKLTLMPNGIDIAIEKSKKLLTRRQANELFAAIQLENKVPLGNLPDSFSATKDAETQPQDEST